MSDDQIESFMLDLLILKNMDRLMDTKYSKVKKACGPEVVVQLNKLLKSSSYEFTNYAT